MNFIYIFVIFFLHPCLISSKIFEGVQTSKVSEAENVNFINKVQAHSNDVRTDNIDGAKYRILANGIPIRNESIVEDNRKVFKRSAQTDTKRISQIKCEQYSRTLRQMSYATYMGTQDWKIKNAVARCARVRFIYGGVAAKRNEFPHMAAVGWRTSEGGYNYNCGGSLISYTFVLTAGHCTYDPRATYPYPVVVFIGNNFVDPNDVPRNSNYHTKIKFIYTHFNYRPPKRYNDIALLKLAKRLDITLERHPACLWGRNDFQSHSMAIATGWGRTQTSEKATDLQKVILMLLSNEVCDPLLVRTRNRNWGGFTRTQLCAGELQGGSDTCQGDSGAPLQVPHDDCLHHVLGVTSFGQGCAKPNLPAVYTRVSEYLDWIESVVWPGH